MPQQAPHSIQEVAFELLGNHYREDPLVGVAKMDVSENRLADLKTRPNSTALPTIMVFSSPAGHDGSRVGVRCAFVPSKVAEVLQPQGEGSAGAVAACIDMAAKRAKWQLNDDGYTVKGRVMPEIAHDQSTMQRAVTSLLESRLRALINRPGVDVERWEELLENLQKGSSGREEKDEL